jgi:hypothetical protein
VAKLRARQMPCAWHEFDGRPRGWLERKAAREIAFRRFWLGPQAVGERASQKPGVAALARVAGRAGTVRRACAGREPSHAIVEGDGARAVLKSAWIGVAPVLTVVHPSALAWHSRWKLSAVRCPAALPPDELHELRSSQHRPGSTLAAVIACSQARHRRDTRLDCDRRADGPETGRRAVLAVTLKWVRRYGLRSSRNGCSVVAAEPPGPRRRPTKRSSSDPRSRRCLDSLATFGRVGGGPGTSWRRTGDGLATGPGGERREERGRLQQDKESPYVRRKPASPRGKS